MYKYLIYCRPNFEKDCAAEIQDQSSKANLHGGIITHDSLGIVEFIPNTDSIDELKNALKYDDLIFCRQLIITTQKISDLDPTNRIPPLIEELNKLLPEKLYKDIIFEYPDTNEGKKLSKFGAKFIHPFTKSLTKSGYKKIYSKTPAPYIHLCFIDYNTCWVGISHPGNRSEHPLGIIRLKFPKDAPSRSTLKLEEAFLTLLSDEERKDLLCPGMQAVDFGACPGGWTYQLVKRDIHVHTVDHGKIDPELMDSGYVTHHSEDAYHYQPQEQMDWLVCDMIDKPSLICRLIAKWFKNNLCCQAVFNLKLPMKKRYQEVINCLETFKEESNIAKEDLIIRCKHLYHDREEVTVYVRKKV